MHIENKELFNSLLENAKPQFDRIQSVDVFNQVKLYI